MRASSSRTIYPSLAHFIGTVLETLFPMTECPASANLRSIPGPVCLRIRYPSGTPTSTTPTRPCRRWRACSAVSSCIPRMNLGMDHHPVHGYQFLHHRNRGRAHSRDWMVAWSSSYFRVSKYATRPSRSFCGTSIAGIVPPDGGETMAFFISSAVLLLPTPSSGEAVLPTPPTEWHDEQPYDSNNCFPAATGEEPEVAPTASRAAALRWSSSYARNFAIRSASRPLM